MRDVSDAFAATVVQPHTRVARVSCLDTDLTVTEVLTEVLDGTVTTDAERRRAVTMTIANPDGIWTPATAADVLYPNRLLRVERGIIVDGQEEYVTLGTFAIDKPRIAAAAKTIEVTGQDRLKFALNSRFTRPTVYESGTPLQDVIYAIARDAGMGTTLYRLNAGNKALGADRVFEQGFSRVDAIRSLAADFALAVYVDADGYLTVESASAAAGDRVWLFRPGEDSILLDVTKDFGDDRLYNHVLVTGEGSDVVPFYAEARDLNPDSPAYNPVDGTGPIGDRLYVYSSPMIRDAQQAQDVADVLLTQVALVEESLTFPTVVHPALEVGDVIGVVEPITRTADEYQIDTIAVPIGGGAMTMTSRKVRALVDEPPVLVTPPPTVPVPQVLQGAASVLGSGFATARSAQQVQGAASVVGTASATATAAGGTPSAIPVRIPFVPGRSG